MQYLKREEQLFLQKECYVIIRFRHLKPIFKKDFKVEINDQQAMISTNVSMLEHNTKQCFLTENEIFIVERNID